MIQTMENIEEAAGTNPCRLLLPWPVRSDCTETKNTNVLQIRYLITPDDIRQLSFTSTSTQTEQNCRERERHHQYQLVNCSYSTAKNSVSTSTQTEYQHANDATTLQQRYYSSTESTSHLDGVLESSLELLNDITNTAIDFVQLTRNAETLFANMPVGTNFENSALKTSFSLSSLSPSTGLEGTEHAKIKNERPYNSLTKKRKDQKQENWRRSWGSSCDTKDDFWSALQANYDYIMDNNLIDSCQDVDQVDMVSPVEDKCNLNNFVSTFTELYSFLNDVQEAVYGKAENVTNWPLRASHMEEMIRVSPRRKLFNEQATKLMAQIPELENEIGWHVNHLNSKWDQIEHALSSNGCSTCEEESCPDVQHEIKCLRKWVKEMESRLQPLNFQLEWTKAELEKKAFEHMVLHRDIESHSKIVNLVVRLCNRANPADAKCHASNARRVASGLERRYHLLFLRSLEWQCHIESLFKLRNSRCQYYSDPDSDEEPCTKQLRLSSDCGNSSRNYPSQHKDDGNEDNDFDDDYSSNDEDVNGTSVSRTDTVMDVGTEPVNVIKMVNKNNNGNERDVNDIELDVSTTGDNHNFGFPVGICSNDKSHSTKDKNMLQKVVAVYNPSTMAATNIGNYVYNHIDTTDSELERKSVRKDESSEDEFTFTKTIPAKQLIENVSQPSDQESIHLLVERVDELVSTAGVDPFMFHSEQQKSKLSRVKEWLNCENSCDASCESTASEDDKESESSEDLNDSIVTCRPQAMYDSHLPLDDAHSNSNLNATSELLSSPEACKVNLRPKRLQMKGNRPWSVACLSQLSTQTSPVKCSNDTLPSFSISESALNNLSISSPTSVRMRSFAAISANSIGMPGNNSTSSTLEESGAVYMNEGSKLMSARKKKIRIRRKSRKTESGSELQIYKSPCYVHTSSSVLPSKSYSCSLVKSGSFSGSGSKILTPERSTASDPSTRPHNHRSNGIKGDTSTTSGADSEEEKKPKLPKFLLGPHLGVAKNYCAPLSKIDYRDSSPEKSSLNTAEEHSSSLSEQAWDNYQDKYLSENYSEAHDSDAARRLLEFGEDYRCYLDSQSDCWSANSQNHDNSPQFRRKAQPLAIHSYAGDSDLEIENFKQHIAESKAQYEYTKDIYEKHVAMGLNKFLVSNDCAGIIANCERHIFCWEDILDDNADTRVLPESDVAEVKSLMLDWMDLACSARKMQNSRVIYNKVISFKNDLAQYAVDPNPTCTDLRSKDEFIAEIGRLKEVQNMLEDKKRNLLKLNVEVHRYIVSEDVPCYMNLKSEISELYTLWNDTCQSVTDRLNNLSTHLQVWAQLESRLEELQSDLRGDERTLQLLDTALKGGIVSMEVASSIRDVAKVLSETHTATQKSMIVTATSGTENAAALFNHTLSLSMLTEGSYSDSGISDEGSEQELSEREHRLAAIRRLVRQLETIMAPDSEERIKMTKRLEEAENELRKLQNQCRGLIVRTAVCADVQSRNDQHSNDTKSQGKRRFSLDSSLNYGRCRTSEPDDDPGDDGSTSGSWFWRVMRASVPFQVAIVALICMAYLLEPNCCDSINNLNLSLTPHFR